MLKVLSRVVTAAIFVIVLVACEKESTTKVLPDETQSKIQIGVSFDSFIIERWQRDRDVIVSTAKELGAQVNVQNANGDLKEQIKQIEYFIDKKVDAIIIICIDSDGLSEVVKKARKEQIKVIAYDRLIKNADVDLYISFDNVAVGKMMAEAMLQKNKSIQHVIMLCGPTTDHNVAMIEEGFRSRLNGKRVSVQDVFYTKDWRPENAANHLYDIESLLTDCDAIMCGNDAIATAAIRVLSEKRLAGKIIVVGQDADLEACQRIVEGTQVFTVYKPVEELAKKAVEMTVSMITDQNEEHKPYHTIFDDTYYVPCYELIPIGVTKENMDEVIIGTGFHLKEEVYLNIVK